MKSKTQRDRRPGGPPEDPIETTANGSDKPEPRSTAFRRFRREARERPVIHERVGFVKNVGPRVCAAGLLRFWMHFLVKALISLWGQ